MAENDVPVPVPNQSEVERDQEHRLKYLQFLQLSLLHALFYASKAYDYAKNNSGPLKPRVQPIEGKLKILLTPAYNKFHHVPVDLLNFVDRKVDESVNKFQPVVNQVSAKTNNLSQELKTACTKLEPVGERYVVSAWQSLNQLPVFPKVAKVVVPTTAYYSEKYNHTVQQAAEKGYRVSSYLPLVPTERISKVFNSV